MTNDSTLTALQSKFIDEYIKTLNPRQSAINAGYSKSNAAYRAAELLKNPRIVAEIHARIESLPDSLVVTKSFIVKKLLQIVAHTAVEEAVTDKNGAPTGQVRLKDAAVALRALDMLAKCYVPEPTQNPDGDGVRLMFIENLDEEKI